MNEPKAFILQRPPLQGVIVQLRPMTAVRRYHAKTRRNVFSTLEAPALKYFRHIVDTAEPQDQARAAQYEEEVFAGAGQTVSCEFRSTLFGGQILIPRARLVTDLDERVVYVKGRLLSSAIARLSPTQLAVAYLLSQHKSRQEIEKILSIKRKTLNAHIAEAASRLGVRERKIGCFIERAVTGTPGVFCPPGGRESCPYFSSGLPSKEIALGQLPERREKPAQP